MSLGTGAPLFPVPRLRGKAGMGANGPSKIKRARRIDAVFGWLRVADRLPPPNPPGPTQRVGRSLDPRGSTAQTDPALPPARGGGLQVLLKWTPA